MLSRGSITSERSRKTLPTDIAPRVAVSSELKTYPTSIPASVNNAMHKKSIGRAFGRALNIWGPKKIAESPMITTTCIESRMRHVINVADMNVMSFVGEIKFLKYAVVEHDIDEDDLIGLNEAIKSWARKIGHTDVETF